MATTPVIPVTLPSLGARGAMALTDAIPSQPSGGTTLLKNTLQDVRNVVLNTIDQYGTGDAAFAAAAALTSGAVYFPAGTYTPTGNHTFSVPVIMEAGALIQAASAVTLTFNGGFSAPPTSQAFGANITAAFSRAAAPPVVYPDWWGSANDAASINAAIASGANVVQLLNRDYLLTSSILMQTPWVKLRGVGWDSNTSPGQTTRLLMLSGCRVAIQVGPSTEPSGGINNFMKGLALEDLFIQKDQTYVAPAPGSEYSSGLIGVNASYTLNARLERVKADETMIGFAFAGNVGLKHFDCVAFRSLVADTPYTSTLTASISGTAMTVTGTPSNPLSVGCAITGTGVASGTVIIGGTSPNWVVNVSQTVASETMTATYDPWWGFYLDGSVNIGAAGGNASTYFVRANATLGTTAIPFGISLYAPALYEDTYVELESSQVPIGVYMPGETGITVGDYNFKGKVYIDQFTLWGVNVTNSSLSSVLFRDGYAACANAATAPGAQAAFAAYDCTGSVVFNNNEAFMNGAAVSAYGELVLNSSGVVMDNRIFDAYQGTAVAGGNSDCTFNSQIVNSNRVGVGPALGSAGTNTALKIGVRLGGAANAFGSGVSLSSGTTRTEVNTTGLDSSLIGGGAANKVISNGAAVALSGFSTVFNSSNYAFGVPG